MTPFLLIGSVLILSEIALRVRPPAILRPPAPLGESPFQYDESFGYETKPRAVIHHPDEHGAIYTETLNDEGCRNSDLPVAKAQGELRLVGLGDSVVQGFSVERPYHWGTLLEKKMGATFLNAGIGGYVSSQLVTRLERHVLRYSPNIAVVLVGWNDLVFSSLPSWKPRMNLTSFERARVETAPRRVRDIVFDASRTLAYARAIRRQRWNEKNRQRIISERQKPSGIPFNEQALEIYEKNLEAIREKLTLHGTRMALVLPPTLLAPEYFDDSAFHGPNIVYYTNFPLSTRDYYEWHSRYNEVRRRFAARHADVTLIDAFGAFSKVGREERLGLFTDLAHLTRAGNEKLSQVVAEALDSVAEQRSKSA